MLRNATSYGVSDKMRVYEAHDYEKVMLLTYMALNRVAMGQFEEARVAIKQTHELEATIEQARARALAEVQAEAKKRGATTSFKELNGYPVETIDNPEVNALKNGYQSALSHYLAGFLYESLGEPSLAAPGYRLANELQPNRPALEDELRATVRATTSAMLQYQAQHNRNSDAAAATAIAAFTATALLQTADDRTWRSLPAQVSIARVRLPPGVHDVTLESAFSGEQRVRI